MLRSIRAWRLLPMLQWLLLFSYLLTAISYAGTPCTGHLINPVKDICWRCIFPLTIGSTTTISGDEPDPTNPSRAVQFCPRWYGYKVGIAVGYWEPFVVTDVTRTPYCMVNLGGTQLHINNHSSTGAVESSQSGTQGAFYQVHWYGYPLMNWLGIIGGLTCSAGGEFGLDYLSELDPTWDDDTSSSTVSPEESQFNNETSQVACIADATAALHGLPSNKLFWCMGAQGSTYPLTGNTPAQYSPLQNAALLSERVDFKMHRFLLIPDSIGANSAVCHEHNLIDYAQRPLPLRTG